VTGERLYAELAEWWPLFAPPGYYEGEARAVMSALDEECDARPRQILEMGSGGGSMAFHLWQYAQLTLLDREEAMLAVSRQCNPSVEHVLDDMRTARLDREFDAVIIHDAINHMISLPDLVAALMTARRHLSPGGVAIVFPDDTQESFLPCVTTGGQDDAASGRGLRYLAWTHSAHHTTYKVDFAIMLRDADGAVRVVHDGHLFGLFSRDMWQEAFRQAGFSAPLIRSAPSRDAVFLARTAT
jgi:trans-aconitate methyltransferase